MPLYRSSAAGLLADASAPTILTARLTDQYRVTHRRVPSPGEQRSWTNSLPELARVLADAGLGKVEVLLEYQLPQTSKRADAVLCGFHPKTGQPSFVVVELKQWTKALPHDDAPELCVVPHLGTVLQPALQVSRYCTYLGDFVRALDGRTTNLTGVAFLHNMAASDGEWLQDLATDSASQVYTAATRAGLIRFLASELSPGAGAPAADILLRSAVGPSRKLLDLAAAEIRDQEQFVLLDEQQVAYTLVMRAVHRAREADAKQVVVVTGGPGSGKSVIALSLLGELSRLGYPVLHATGSKAFTTTLRRVAGFRAPRVQAMFKYFNNFTASRKNELDVLIADEAHRLRKSSANRYTKAEQRTGRSQTEELIDAARVPVFLLDENQVVRPGEVGTVAEIQAVAEEKKLELVQINLDGQFRAGGSAAYDAWVARLLGLQPGGPIPWTGDDGRYVVEIADSPSALEAELSSRRVGEQNARMTAGFCWDWSDPIGNGLVADVRIGDWHRPWNVKGDRKVGEAPPSQLWATDPNGFGQVGCVYTAQGFEYDWNGVILGPDLVWRQGFWVTDPGRSRDTVVKRGVASAEFDVLIRNTYKVLLTRGMVGTVLYSTDPETQEFLRTLAG